MKNEQAIILKRGKEASLLRGHRWVFSGAIAQMPDGLVSGDVVEVRDAKGAFLGRGHFHPEGSIAVRLLTRANMAIDSKFWVNALGSARALRQSLGFPSASTTAYRLVNAEGDGLPGLIIDCYGSAAVIQTHTTGMARCASEIADALKVVLAHGLATIIHRDASVKQAQPVFLLGNSVEAEVLENGLRFMVNWAEGQKTGFFLDQRDSRAILGQMAHGRNMLNAFCYTGGFSMYALAGGAAHVTSIDISQRAMQMVQRNHMANGFDNGKHELLCGDVFDHLATATGHDLIVLDPPAFAKNLKARHTALTAYRRLNAAGMKALTPGGLLFTFSCTQVVSRDQFEGAVLAAALDCGRHAMVLRRLGHGTDHPVSLHHPEGDYLKGLVLSVQ